MQGECHGAAERRLARDESALLEERTGGGNPYLYFVAHIMSWLREYINLNVECYPPSHLQAECTRLKLAVVL